MTSLIAANGTRRMPLRTAPLGRHTTPTARHKLEPFVTLYHFCHPQWFEELGGFVKQENIQIFVDWCLYAFREFGMCMSSAQMCAADHLIQVLRRVFGQP